MVTGIATAWSEPPPSHVIAMGSGIGHAGALVYADGIDIAAAATPIGLSCRPCDWPGCRSRAFPPLLDHRLSLDVNRRLSAPMMSAPAKR